MTEENEESRGIRCVQCRKEFDSDFLKSGEYDKCPNCGTEARPCYTDDDFFLHINTHELRILTIWADQFVGVMKEEDQQACRDTLEAILKQIRTQLPHPVALTIREELESLQESYPEVEAFDGAGKRILKKRFIN